MAGRAELRGEPHAAERLAGVEQGLIHPVGQEEGAGALRPGHAAVKAHGAVRAGAEIPERVLLGGREKGGGGDGAGARAARRQILRAFDEFFVHGVWFRSSMACSIRRSTCVTSA